MNEKSAYYFEPPDVSDYVSPSPGNSSKETNWLDWLGIVDPDKRKSSALDADTYFKTTLYVRIIPAEVGLGNYKSPEVWKLIVINNTWVISVQKVITPFDMIPILFSDIREDGLGWQTKSPGEQMIPYEDMATELLNTRLQGSRRALADRAIYDSDYLDQNQVNGRIPDAKIPLKKNLRNLGDRPSFNEVYYPIPFEGQGVINSMTDLNTIMQIKDQVNGQNFTSRGERQKGNRTAREFSSIEATTQSKSLPYAIRLEEQVFSPGKLIIKTFILLNQRAVNEKERVIDPYTNEERELDLVSMRSKMLDFKITDGLFPKQSIQDPDLLMTIMQVIGTNKTFDQSYDSAKVLADLLHTVNIDADKYRRKPNDIQTAPPAAAQPGPATPPTGGNTEGVPEA
jgi:hypothetical protein